MQPVARRVEMSTGSSEHRVSPVIATAQVNLDKLQAQGAQIQAHKTSTPNQHQQVKQEPDNQPQISAGHNNQNNNTNFNKYQDTPQIDESKSLEKGICSRTHGLTGFRFDGSDVGTPEHASSPSTSSER